MLKDNLIKASLVNYLLYSMAFPVIQKTLIDSVSSKYIAANSIITCLMVIVLGQIWNKYNKKMYKLYGVFLLFEGLFYTSLINSVIFGIVSYKFFYIVDTLIFALISKNITFGYNKLKSIRYKENKRNGFDNNILIITSIASLIGYSISFIIDIPVKLAFGFVLIGIIINNIGFYLVYKKENKG